MEDFDIESTLGGVFESLGSLNQKEAVKLQALPCNPGQIDELIEQHIYGLLALDELSPGQLTLLSILMPERTRPWML